MHRSEETHQYWFIFVEQARRLFKAWLTLYTQHDVIQGFALRVIIAKSPKITRAFRRVHFERIFKYHEYIIVYM